MFEPNTKVERAAFTFAEAYKVRNLLSVRKMFILSLVLMLGWVGFSSGTLPKKLDPIAPDSVYYNGKIITMDSDSSIAEAVAVKDGKIISVGTNKEISKLKGRQTETINLNNKVMLQGFIDAHSHLPSSGSAKLFQADLQGPPVGPVENIDDLIAALKEEGGNT
ncbi:hypothetical protein [Lentibacillus juripiscarius]|uniref:Amidohydrolase 3 domain-containing protein n=1 Tax=Lentibacillus juripiscarius TaxID=257446 RepID=A0ABW5V321_9BACI